MKHANDLIQKRWASLKKILRYKKIRGLKRKVAHIPKWIEGYLEFHQEHLNNYKYNKAKIYVDPWDNLNFTNSQIQEPKGKAKREILKGLEKIYDAWKIELEKLNKPYYLKIWIYEPRVSKSQVVCRIEDRIEDRIEHYENLFIKADFKPNKSSFTNELIADFKWQSKIDEEEF